VISRVAVYIERVCSHMRLVIGLVLLSICGRTSIAQINSWLSPFGGNWHDAHWSAGVLPGMNQTILITNENSKTVRIGADTALSYPETLRMESLTVSAPGNSTNTLLVDAALTNRPFSSTGVNIGLGGVMTVLGALSQWSGFRIEGSVRQGGPSDVVVGDVELQNSGSYYLTNGMLRTSGQYIRFQGAFDQQGGTNLCLSIVIDGTYNISAGHLQSRFHHAVNSIIVRGTLNQSGGIVDGALLLKGLQSHYNLSGGLRMSGPTIVGSGPDFSSGHILQTGGTNQGGEIRIVPYIDSYSGDGRDSSYTLANGEVRSTIVTISPLGTFAQYGGRHVSESITVSSQYLCKKRQPGAYPDCDMAYGRYILSDGVLESSSIGGATGRFSQGGGRLTVDTIQWMTFSHSGGELRVNHLVVGSFSQGGGELIVSNITVRGAFSHEGGTVEHRGWIEFVYGSWQAGAGQQDLGPVHLGNLPEGSAGGPWPSVLFPTNTASVLRFADSSSSEWASDNKLIVRNWNGSFRGGGVHQLRFGRDKHALTQTQVGQIHFQDPAGIRGILRARILSDGEVVPLPMVAAEKRGAQFLLHWPPGFILQTSTNVNGPFQDAPDALSSSPLPFADPFRFFRVRPESQ